MAVNETILSKKEQQWIVERRVTRLTDNKEVQIYPMGAERYLSTVLTTYLKDQYNIRDDIENKDVLVIPGYGNSWLLFALSGAKSVTVYDKDPVTIAWIKAFKKYYHYCDNSYPSVGELLTALTCWYPPLINLPHNKFSNVLFWLLQPNLLRRTYIHYMVSLVRDAVRSNISSGFELEKNVSFHAGTLDSIFRRKDKEVFDTAFVPYLLGVKNGIEKVEDIVSFIQQLLQVVPRGHILVTPSQNNMEFYLFGTRYFVTTSYQSLTTIPDLRSYVIAEDKNWFRKQVRLK